MISQHIPIFQIQGMNNSVSTSSGKTKLKIVFLGNQSVGKSSIIEKYVKDVFDESSNPTVGIDFLVKNITHKTKSYRLQLWDTAGQQRFRSLIPNYLKDAKCALIVFDVTSKASLNNAETWLSLYNDNRTGDGFAFLVGNKIDLDYREVTSEEGKKKAQELGIPYFQLSAKTGENIQTLFLKIVDVSQEGPSGMAGYEPEGKKDKGEPSQIKESAQQQQEDKKDKQKQRYLKVPTPVAPATSTTDNTTVVLKNQKIQQNKLKDKKKAGCC